MGLHRLSVVEPPVVWGLVDSARRIQRFNQHRSTSHSSTPGTKTLLLTSAHQAAS